MLFIFSDAFGKTSSYRNCVVIPMQSNDKAETGFQESLSKYLQSSSWCVSKSSNDLFSILNKYKKNISKLIFEKKLRKKISDVALSNTMVFVRKLNQESYRLEVWSRDGLLHERTLTDGLNLNETIDYLEEYAKKIPYDAKITDIDNGNILLDGGTRFGFHYGDGAKVFNYGYEFYHPRTNEFIGFKTTGECYHQVILSNHKTSLLKSNPNCKHKPRIGNWVRLVDIVKGNNANKNYNDYKKNFLDISTGFGISALSHKIVSDDYVEISGPSFSFEVNGDLLLTRNILTSLRVEGLYSILTPAEGDTNSDLYNIFGNSWNFYVSYRHWLKILGDKSFIDLGLGYDSNYFGFDSNESDLITGQKYYGISVKGNLLLEIKGFEVFSKISFFPNAGFNQDIKYLDKVDNVLGYDFQIGGMFRLWDFQNLFSVLKISKYKASSSFNSNEVSIQDIGITVGYKFRI